MTHNDLLSIQQTLQTFINGAEKIETISKFVSYVGHKNDFDWRVDQVKEGSKEVWTLKQDDAHILQVFELTFDWWFMTMDSKTYDQKALDLFLKETD
jgi:hypothetical protein